MEGDVNDIYTIHTMPLEDGGGAFFNFSTHFLTSLTSDSANPGLM